MFVVNRHQENINEVSSYVLMNKNMLSTLLGNIKYDECDMHSLDVVTKGTYGFSSKSELTCQNLQ